jgi:hypothetical protein
MQTNGTNRNIEVSLVFKEGSNQSMIATTRLFAVSERITTPSAFELEIDLTMYETGILGRMKSFCQMTYSGDGQAGNEYQGHQNSYLTGDTEYFNSLRDLEIDLICDWQNEGCGLTSYQVSVTRVI